MGFRIRFIGGIVAVLGALTLAWSAPAAWGYGPGGGSATISASVSQSNGLTTLTVTGSGFGADETVNFVAYNPTSSLGGTTSDASGAISATLTLPSGFGAGPHTLTGTGSVSGNSGSTTFTLAAPSQPTNPCPATTSASAPGRIVLAAFHSAPCIANGLPSNGTPRVVGPKSAGTPRAANVTAGGLPVTGTDAQLLAGLGAAAVCGGGLVVLASRRRRNSAWR